MDDMPKENPFLKRAADLNSTHSTYATGCVGTSFPSHAVAYGDVSIRYDVFQDLCKHVEDIHHTVCVESLPERYAVNRLTKLLEDRSVPPTIVKSVSITNLAV